MRKKVIMIMAFVLLMSFPAFANDMYVKEESTAYTAPDENCESHTDVHKWEVVECTSSSDEWSHVLIDDQWYFIKSSNLITSEEYENTYGAFEYHEEIPLTEEEQMYLWDECYNLGIKYCFALGTIELESGRHYDDGTLKDFNYNAYNKNDNGTIDRGICQVNSCWISDLKSLGYITCKEDLYDPCTGIRCGMWVLKNCVDEYGNTERAYAFYNTGNSSVKSNRNSRKVVEYWEKWKSIVGDY